MPQCAEDPSAKPPSFNPALFAAGPNTLDRKLSASLTFPFSAVKIKASGLVPIRVVAASPIRGVVRPAASPGAEDQPRRPPQGRQAVNPLTGTAHAHRPRAFP